ncbi:multicopper oxidase family protein [Lichenifustis flavocetrariae]|uniref:Multicopper oxidase family protein n=1 Tax=Lichenifustis flavocetrariae TaxID=2949735 RepID=A0AA41Z0J5_9HYPH|nr:multicopper oxidase family protein [Lichenifustis flavocetrariae]MCW6507092.1 multicopper oxidase family protein [Lichenifustis flavocetrariae]
MISKRRFVAGAAAATVVPLLSKGGKAAQEEGADFTLRAEQVDLQLSEQGPSTALLRYSGAGALPVIRIRKGAAAAFRIRNDLTEPTSLQWHGLRGIGALDEPTDIPSDSIAPGEDRTARVLPLDPGTAWFHPDPSASNQTARGLRGLLIVEESEPPAVDQDLVALFGDHNLSAGHSLEFGSRGLSNTVATIVTTNGWPSPETVTSALGARLRVRLVNGSTQRVMVVACEGARPVIVAIDGQPSDLFAPVRGVVPIAPGARFDVMLDMPATTDAAVRFVLKGTEAIQGRVEPERPLLVIRTAGPAKAPKPPIAPLDPNPALPREIPLEAAKRVDLVIEGAARSSEDPSVIWTINGIDGRTASKPVLSVRRGDAVTLGFVNKSAMTIPLRFHGLVLRLLHAKDDGWEPYWRDTLLLPPNSSNHAAFLADRPGRWPMTSGFDDLTLAGLRCWIEVKPA